MSFSNAQAMILTVVLTGCRRWPLPLPLLLATVVAVAVSHHRLSLPSSSPLPSPSKQFKQIILAIFYLVWAVSGALIAVDDWPGVRWQWTLANTSIRWWAARNERLVGASGWRQGGSRVETLPAYWLAMRDVVLLCCWDASCDRWCLWWCVGWGRRQCRWDSD